MNIFRGFAVVALCISLGMHWLAAIDWLAPIALFIFNICIIAGLSLVAVIENRRSKGAFDSAIAAETLVAFGVLALVLGLVTALYPILAGGQGLLKFDSATLTRLGTPFLQGLATAAIAPVVAVLVRHMSTGSDPAHDLTVQFNALSQAAVDMAARLDAAGQQANELAGVVKASAAALKPLGAELEQHVKQIGRAASQLVPTLDANLQNLVMTLGTDLAALAAQFEQTQAQLGKASVDTRTEIEKLGTSAKAGRDSVLEAAEAMQRLSHGADGTAQLLDALGAMIASVETFVATRVRQP